MPPLPMRPMKTPWPMRSCHGFPSDETAKPTHTIAAPNITVQRTPMRSAMRPIMMPPTPTPIQPKEPANAGVSRAPPNSAAIDLSATTATHGAPNENASVRSATVATTQDVRVSMVPTEIDEYVKAAPSRNRHAQENADTSRKL